MPFTQRALVAVWLVLLSILSSGCHTATAVRSLPPQGVPATEGSVVVYLDEDWEDLSVRDGGFRLEVGQSIRDNVDVALEPFFAVRVFSEGKRLRNAPADYQLRVSLTDAEVDAGLVEKRCRVKLSFALHDRSGKLLAKGQVQGDGVAAPDRGEAGLAALSRSNAAAEELSDTTTTHAWALALNEATEQMVEHLRRWRVPRRPAGGGEVPPSLASDTRVAQAVPASGGAGTLTTPRPAAAAVAPPPPSGSEIRAQVDAEQQAAEQLEQDERKREETSAAGYRRHDGLLLRFAIGGGGSPATVRGQAMFGQDTYVDPSVSGGAFVTTVTAGWSITDEVALHVDAGLGNVWGDFTFFHAGVRGGVTYFFMPINMYVSAAAGVAATSTSRRNSAASSGTGTPMPTNARATAFSSSLTFGKEWWLGANWALGPALRGEFLYANNEGLEYVVPIVSVLATMTFN